MKNLVSILYYIVVVTFSVIFMCITFCVWVITSPLGKKLNGHITCYSTRIWFPIVYWTGWLWGWRIKIEGTENLPKDGPCIIMSNHQGYLDIPIFLYLKAVTLRWVSKWEVIKIPIVGEVLVMRGDVRVKRGSGASAKHMIEKCMENLKMGFSIVIYPEGTRTKTGEIGPFKAGAFLLAKQSEYPIVPAVIVGNYECMREGKVNLGNKFKLKIMPPISKEEVVATDTKTLMNKTREIIVSTYEKERIEQ